MLTNLRSANLLLILAALTCIIAYFFPHLSRWWLLLPAFLFIAVLAYASATIQTGFYGKTFCSAKTTQKIIALTFDDGPHPLHTPQVLDLLAEYKVPATFFVIGRNISGNEAILKRMQEEGHLIGNHTWSHSFFIDLKNKAGFLSELDRTAASTQKITGRLPKFFRPPYGVTTPALVSASEKRGYSIIGWNIRSLDTTGRTVEKITERVLHRIRPGAIILFHDTSAKTIGVLRQTLNFAKENGFKIVSTQELLNLPAYA